MACRTGRDNAFTRHRSALRDILSTASSYRMSLSETAQHGAPLAIMTVEVGGLICNDTGMTGGIKRTDGSNPAHKGYGEATLPDIDTQSEGFRLNREARRNALIEDYVELIADLLAEGHEARQVDIATRLGVSQPTVAKMLTRLANEGYVHRRPYRGVFLTERGQEIANQTKKRHQIVESFLRALGISEDTVRVDAEGIEHYVSDETLEAFDRALRQGLADLVARA